MSGLLCDMLNWFGAVGRWFYTITTALTTPLNRVTDVGRCTPGKKIAIRDWNVMSSTEVMASPVPARLRHHITLGSPWGFPTLL